jgi:uncharacterized protein involved in response to NO
MQPPTETEQSFRAPAGPLWRADPFRVFFPLGVVLAWVGVSHWLFYGVGLSSTYSCELHGFIQMQGFMLAFAVGFLLTALPRRTQTAPPTGMEMTFAFAALVATTAGAFAERWWIAEAGYAFVFILLLRFAIRRFLGREAGRRPPAAFVLIPIGVAQGLAGAACIAAASLQLVTPRAMSFGKLLVEQGVFLCLVMGIGSLVLPLMGGTAPPPDLGSSPRETRKAVAYAAAGFTVFASFVLEHIGYTRVGPALRAFVFAAALAAGGGAWRRPAKAGLHRQLVWLAVWLIPVGLLASAAWPDYRVPALHILFIGGFGLMAFGVATHVSFAHIGLERFSTGWPPAVVALAIGFLLALAARLAADASETYFDHLAWAAGLWLVASLIWLAFLGPHFLGRTRS